MASEEMCKSKCNERNESTNLNCFAYEFDESDKTCRLFDQISNGDGLDMIKLTNA